MTPFAIDKNAYNRFVNLDSVEFRIIDFLAKSENKYAENLFKILKYNSEDCLHKDNLSYEEKMSLLYKNNGDASDERIYMSPYIDDAYTVQSSHLHIYVYSVIPQNHIISTVNIGIETIVHNKISNIYGDASLYNSQSNPSELGPNGEPIIIYKSRASELLKCVLAALNGSFVAGVGTLQFNSQLTGSESKAKMSLWNGKKFFGHMTILSTMMSGASVTPGCGY